MDAGASSTTQKKGRPTPTRKEAEAARRQPLVPVDRKAAQRQARDESRRARMEQREAFARGDEKALPARDRGPVKRHIRDVVDSRWNFGEFVLPLMIVVLALSLVRDRNVQAAMFVVLWFVVAALVIDGFFLVRRVKRAVREKFGEEPPKGYARYAVTRAFQLRMGRRPGPQVKRGQRV